MARKCFWKSGNHLSSDAAFRPRRPQCSKIKCINTSELKSDIYWSVPGISVASWRLQPRNTSVYMHPLLQNKCYFYLIRDIWRTKEILLHFVKLGKQSHCWRHDSYLRVQITLFILTSSSNLSLSESLSASTFSIGARSSANRDIGPMVKNRLQFSSVDVGLWPTCDTTPINIRDKLCVQIQARTRMQDCVHMH